MEKYFIRVSTILSTIRTDSNLETLVTRFIQKIEICLVVQIQERKPSLEGVVVKFVQTVDDRFKAHETMTRSQQDSLLNLENQVGQIGRIISEEQETFEEQVMESSLECYKK